MSTPLHADSRQLSGEPAIAVLRSDELGREAVRIMNDRFKGYKLVELDISDVKPHEPIGYSNSYRLGAVAPVIRQLRPGAWPIKPEVLERALRDGKLPDADTAVPELGLVVYSLEGPNIRLAQVLIEQARERGIDIEFPMVFYNFETAKVRFPYSRKYDGGLRFEIGEIGVAHHQKILIDALESKSFRGRASQVNAFKYDDEELVKSGFPSELDTQNFYRESRELLSGESGLRRYYRVPREVSRGYHTRGVGHDIVANDRDISRTGSNRRIILQIAGTAEELEKIVLAELEAEELRSIRRIEKRYAEALAHFRKKD